MILQTYKISLTDLKISCSTTIYKNFSFTMRIQNREYTIFSSTSYFNGTNIVKNRFIDTIDFQFDLERNKYLPKQIQLELKLIYRTGKINQKIYPVNLNEFITLRKGIKSKTLKIFQRLYSLECSILAKSNDTDSPIINRQSNNLQRIKSESKFQTPLSPRMTQSGKRRFYNSKSPQPVIKYTIKENIKITRNQQPLQKSIYSENSINEYQEKQILKETFQQKRSDSSSFQQRNQQFLLRSKSHTKKLVSNHQSSNIIVNSPVIRQNQDRKDRIKVLNSTIQDLKKQLQKQKQNNYKLQKESSTLKNKIQHLYHQKTLLLKQKQEDRQVFETRDKQQKIRQRRQIDNIKRHYAGLLAQKDKQLNLLGSELNQTYNISINNLNKASQCQYKIEQISSVLNKKIVDLENQITIKNEHIYIKNQEINNMINIENQHRKQIQQIELDKNQLEDHLRSLETQFHHNKYTESTRQQITQQTINNNEQLDKQNQQLYNLVQKQTKTYHQMIAKLQENMRKLQSSLQDAENQHSKTSKQLSNKQIILFQKNQQVSKLSKKIKYLEDQLFSQRKKNLEFKTLLTDVKNTQLQQRDNIQNEKRRLHYRSYSLGSEWPGRETVRIKTTQRYRLIYEPQSSIIYVPPIKYYSTVNEFKRPQQNNPKQQYGKNFKEYNALNNDSQNFSSLYTVQTPYVKYTDGYFGSPLAFDSIHLVQNEANDKIDKQFSNINKQISTLKKRQNTWDTLAQRSKSNSKIKTNQYKSNYLEDYIFDKKDQNNDDYIVSDFQDSYINQNGDYVKQKRKTVYKKN